jgi:hypothetical protein
MFGGPSRSIEEKTCMLSGAVSAALLWLAAGLPQAAVHPAGEARVVENIYYAQLDGMT